MATCDPNVNLDSAMNATVIGAGLLVMSMALVSTGMETASRAATVALKDSAVLLAHRVAHTSATVSVPACLRARAVQTEGTLRPI